MKTLTKLLCKKKKKNWITILTSGLLWSSQCSAGQFLFTAFLRCYLAEPISSLIAYQIVRISYRVIPLINISQVSKCFVTVSISFSMFYYVVRISCWVIPLNDISQATKCFVTVFISFSMFYYVVRMSCWVIPLHDISHNNNCCFTVSIPSTSIYGSLFGLVRFVWVLLCNSISTFLDYLIPNPSF